MGKLVVSLDNVVIKEFQITKDRTTLGRRPYNDIVIDNLAVSGEHAVLLAVGNELFIADLNSTTATYIYAPPPSVAMLPASIKVLNGGAAGREVLLTKVVTTVGKPGMQVASIAKRPTGYVLSHVEGAGRPSVNGDELVQDVISLKNGDIIELAGTQMQFIQG